MPWRIVRSNVGLISGGYTLGNERQSLTNREDLTRRSSLMNWRCFESLFFNENT